MLTKLTLRPAPKTPSSVITKSSLNSVPITITVSKPSPPSMLTGALTAYWIRSAPPPPLRSVERAVVFLRAGERERLDEERVVAGVAEQVQRVEVVEDDEVVVADAAVDRHRLADAVREPALRRLDRREDVLGRDAGERGRAARAVELADLEEVVALRRR